MSTRPTNRAQLVTAAAVMLGLAACGSANADNTPSGTAGGSEGATGSAAVLEIADFAFVDLTVAPGVTVEVSNTDEAPHTVTSTDNAFDSGTVDGGGSASLVAPDESGTYDFACSIHPQMRGSITVA